MQDSYDAMSPKVRAAYGRMLWAALVPSSLTQHITSAASVAVDKFQSFSDWLKGLVEKRPFGPAPVD